MSGIYLGSDVPYHLTALITFISPANLYLNENKWIEEFGLYMIVTTAKG